jgi:hypothetical protein
MTGVRGCTSTSRAFLGNLTSNNRVSGWRRFDHTLRGREPGAARFRVFVKFVVILRGKSGRFVCLVLRPTFTALKLSQTKADGPTEGIIAKIDQSHG